MRNDMHEVITERPRWGSRMRHARRHNRVDPKRAAARDPDSLPFHKSLRRSAVEGWMTKSFSDLLGPLKRYLARQVDRPWNKVWSEISATVKGTKVAQQHLRGHVLDFVAVKTSVRGGVVWVTDGHRGGRTVRLADCARPFYVDPRTGILRVNKSYRRFPRRNREMEAAGKRHREARVHKLSPLVEAHRLDDNWWWEIRLVAVMRPAADVLVGSTLTKLSARQLYGRDDVHAVARRQLSRGEVEALGLKT